jgi:hypothetical protein
LCPQLVSLILLLVLLFAVLIGHRCVEGLLEGDAMEECVLGLWVHRALLVHDLLILVLLVPRLATQVPLNSHDFIIFLALLGGCRVVPLALVGAVVVVVLVVVAIGEAFVLLIILAGPSLHHLAELHDSLGVIAADVTVDVLHGKAVLEAVDDILIGDVGDGGTHLEEGPGVGPQGLVLLLLDLKQVMMITCSEYGALEVVDEDLHILLGVDGVFLEAFELGEWCGL